jgi:hypothetical protein
MTPAEALILIGRAAERLYAIDPSTNGMLVATMMPPDLMAQATPVLQAAFLRGLKQTLVELPPDQYDAVHEHLRAARMPDLVGQFGVTRAIVLAVLTARVDPDTYRRVYVDYQVSGDIDIEALMEA